ncbi:Tn3 family transposase [Sinimarinibacterium flocculans]|uniref:TnpA family transposase n=1 Tax=Sinimarinibacterium flocculans TaxID=985250 RepID=A0A318E1U3_9GAMM|nr:Tn3 family transposase [Sinimarinibacterium flocculans]PXV63694.1 TnpA family transposase [Sinimarinibacterium flocculans]
MRRKFTELEMAEHWTLSPKEMEIPAGKSRITRLGYFVLLKYFQYENSFPTTRRDIPTAVVEAIGDQLSINPALFSEYRLDDRTASRHRSAIREHLGVREATNQDGQPLIDWLIAEVLPHTSDDPTVEAEVDKWLRRKKIESPSDERIKTYVASAKNSFEKSLYQRLLNALPEECLNAIDAMLQLSDPELIDGQGPDTAEMPDGETAPLTFHQIKSDPGRASLESVFREVAKLNSIKCLMIPDAPWLAIPPRELEVLKRRTSSYDSSELRQLTSPARYVLVAVYCWLRRREILDGFVELLVSLIHRIDVRAERRVEKELLNDFKRVRGKSQMLFKIAELSVENPDGVISDVIFPIVPKDSLDAVVKEFKSGGPAFRTIVHKVMRNSYSNHYRQMLPRMLDNLVFRSNNTLHQPVIEALEILRTYRNDRFQYFPDHVDLRLESVVPAKWRDVVLEEGKDGNERINRINYEICVLQSLRIQLRCREIWVEGARKYGNPDEDLPSDFNERRADYYADLDLPSESNDFINKIRLEMAEALQQLNDDLPRNRYVKLREVGMNRIALEPLDEQKEPENLHALKIEINKKWPATGLLDILKETEFRVGVTDCFKTAASREALEKPALQRRLLLSLYGLGTNTGLKRVVTSEIPESYKDLVYAKRRYITREFLRNAIGKVVNATFAARDPEIWGEGTTACASDSKKFGSWDQNLMTEWHIRYGGRGVMIYWHVERKSVCIYSQLKKCSSSEVAAMMEGVLRHCSDMEVEKNYVDSHGQSAVGFAFSRLLGFELLPRLKAISKQRLYLPGPGTAANYPKLAPILARSIDWGLIAQQYDEMVRFASAMSNGVDAESVLRRFTRENAQHPTYRALQQLGLAAKTIFLCRYLNSLTLRQEIHEGLNVVENWNSANSFIFYGKSGEVATNRLEDQELSVLCLHLLQSSLVYVNTLMIQRVLREKQWRRRLKPEDLRALTPLIYLHVNPYGEFKLDMGDRIQIESM